MKRHASAESIRRIIETIIAAVGVTSLGVLRDSDCPCFNKAEATPCYYPREITGNITCQKKLVSIVAMYSHHSPWKMVPPYSVLDYLPCSLTPKLKLVGYHSVIGSSTGKYCCGFVLRLYYH